MWLTFLFLMKQNSISILLTYRDFFIPAQHIDFLQGLMREVFLHSVSYAILTSFWVLHMCFR